METEIVWVVLIVVVLIPVVMGLFLLVLRRFVSPQVLGVERGLRDLIHSWPIEQGALRLSSLILDSTSPALDKNLSDLDLPTDAVVAAIMREGRPIIPRGQTSLRAGDRLIIVMLPEAEQAVLAKLYAARPDESGGQSNA